MAKNVHIIHQCSGLTDLSLNDLCSCGSDSSSSLALLPMASAAKSTWFPYNIPTLSSFKANLPDSERPASTVQNVRVSAPIYQIIVTEARGYGTFLVLGSNTVVRTKGS